MFGLHPIDITVIFAYLILLVVIGFVSARSVKNTGDFFVGGRRFGKIMIALLGFGTVTHADQVVGVISKSYTVGFAGIWYEWIWLMTTPFYWMAPVIRRIRVVTTADFFLKRYNRSIATLYAVMGIPFWLGIAWRRANPSVVWASFIVSAAVFLSCEMELFIGYKVPLPFQMIAYLTAGLSAGLLAGYITKPQPQEQLDTFFKDITRPVVGFERLERDTM